MKLRRYTPEDCTEILQLFYDTVHTVCLGDYTPAQVDAWAPILPDTARWSHTLAQNYTLVARQDGVLLGFADLCGAYLDRLYVARDALRRGVGSALEAQLAARARQDGHSVLETHASITARPFFARRDYQVLQMQQVLRSGELLTNYVMQKQLSIKRP